MKISALNPNNPSRREKYPASAAHNSEHSERRRLFPRIMRIFVPAFFLLLLAATICCILVCAEPVTAEVGEIPDYSHITDSNFMNRLCKIDADISAVDTSKPGSMTIPLKFIGFIRLHSSLRIVDTVKPKIVPQNVCATVMTELSGEMFAKEVEDESRVSFEIVSPEIGTDSPGETQVTVAATDEGGNTVEFQATLTVVDPGDTLTFECGTSAKEIEQAIRTIFPRADELQIPDVTDCGDFFVTGKNEGTAFCIRIGITDTTAPVATVRSFDIALGDLIPDDEFIDGIADQSEVTVEFLIHADFGKPGEQTVNIRFTDTYGNSSDYTSFIRIHDIENEITVEINSPNAVLSDLIFRDEWSKNCLFFRNKNVLCGVGIGLHEIALEGEYSSVPIKVCIVDTAPPDFDLKEESFPLGFPLKAADLVSSCSDATDVTYSFGSSPDRFKEGSRLVTVIATDASGNTATRETEVTFYEDNTPPVISGCSDISLKFAESYDFASGVSACDSAWGEVNVCFDPTAVDVRTPGVYPLEYTATDGSGNTAKETVTVTVAEPVRVCLDVSNILQNPALPNGCEVVSLAIALNYAGYTVDPVALYDDFMPKTSLSGGDPWTAYVGDAKGQGLGCYAPCVVETGNAYLASVGSSQTVADVSGQNFSYYEELIDGGTPVILWGLVEMSGNGIICWENTVNGEKVVWHCFSHCMTLIGYTDYTYIFCDPLQGITEYDKSDVEKSFSVNFKQACIVQ